MNLIPEWKQAYKWLSVQFSTVGAAVALTWTALSAEQQASMLDFLGVSPGAIVAGMFVLVVVGRLTAQTPK